MIYTYIFLINLLKLFYFTIDLIALSQKISQQTFGFMPIIFINKLKIDLSNQNRLSFLLRKSKKYLNGQIFCKFKSNLFSGYHLKLKNSMLVCIFKE